MKPTHTHTYIYSLEMHVQVNASTPKKALALVGQQLRLLPPAFSLVRVLGRKD